MTETTAFNGNDIEHERGVKPARGNDQRIQELCTTKGQGLEFIR